ncbi:MAG TPA: VanW family protein, partial [Chloroflexota bacterium]|nr:VanW family protein [Chloroflexota bacterium]
VTSDHTVQLRQDRSGAQLDEAGARRVIAAALMSATNTPVQLPVSPVAPAIPSAALLEARSQAMAFLSGPVTLVYEGHTWALGIDQLQSALAIPNVDGSGRLTPLGIDQATLDRVVGQVAHDLDRPVQNAELTLKDGKVVVVPEQSGRAVDVAATEGLIRKALASNDRTVTPVVRVVTPAVNVADWASEITAANKLIDSPVAVNGPGHQSWKLSTVSLEKMLVLPKQPGDSPSAQPQLDRAKLSAFVASIAKDVDREPLNARFQLANGKATVLRPGLDGLKVDQPATIAAIQIAASSGNRAVSLVVSSVPPVVGADEAAKLAGLKLIADNSTSYVGSIPPRRHNVELATSLLNGVVVPPGAIFSFNRELGPASLDRGFQVGYGIEAQGDTVKTVPSVAGGICQVATTLFQPVFWTGYEIESRYAHAYFIAHYVSHGDPGLDTTVDEQSGLDFQFKNDTPSDLLIQSNSDGSNVHFQVYGVTPTWNVKVDAPVISNVVKTDRTLQVQQDPTLPKGRQIYTEAAEDGFTVLVRRTVTDTTGHTRVLDLRSVYEPAHNVMVVGSKPA